MAWRYRGTVVLGCLLAAVALGAACAAGSEGGDDTPDGGSDGSGGDGGMPQGGSGGAGGMAGMGGMPPMCTEDPCKLTVPQCGCPSGEKCTLITPALTERGCVMDGTVGINEACTSAVPDPCQAGAMCLTLQGLSTCFRFCAEDSDCGNFPGAKCILQLPSMTGDKFCSVNCDPVSGVGCTAGKCDVFVGEPMPTYFTACGGAGTGTQGTPCSASEDCAANFGCFNVSQDPMVPDLQCLKWCNLATPNCISPAQCVGFQTPIVIGAIEYGVCL